MTVAGKRNGQKKHKQNRAAQVTKSPPAAKRKTRAAPLNALPDARKQDHQGKRRHFQRPHNGGKPRSAGLDVVGLVNRRTKAFLELPTRMARCHSPLEMWGVQARFMQENFVDYAQHMTCTLRAFDHAAGNKARP